ncbi:AAA family ATPase [Sphingobacterium thalpophilum]|uniref:AAA family ATPase n=1 Tax=Sphingobacterium thalpophilum TaxID=259 RepID=UPI003D970413
MLDIRKIHEDVYNYLMRCHRKDNNFLFTFRRSNRKDRLTKGYWFLGDDYYMAISFWTGNDSVSKTPRIAFTINIHGDCYLEFHSKDFGYGLYNEQLLSRLGIKGNSNSIILKKYQASGPEKFLECLEDFIANDKSLIDNAVRNDTLLRYERTDYDYIDNAKKGDISEPEYSLSNIEIDFLYPSDFEKQLSNVLEYKKQHKERFRATGYLRGFAIKNFGSIKELTIANIPDGCKWIFLTGENGAGKTSLLRALATGLCNNNDGDRPIAENYHDFEISITLDDVVGLKETTIFAEDDYRKKATLPRGFAAYGPVRLITLGTADDLLFSEKAKGTLTRKAYGLFHPISILQDISIPFGMLSKPDEHNLHEQDLLESIEYNLTELLPNIEKVEIIPNATAYEIKYFQGDKDIPNGLIASTFNDLPSGTKNFAALILDLILNFTQQFVTLRDITNLNGIVLIDEIDLHLHPKMQKEIVRQLSETFPKMQFIVTTHSPIPLLGAPENSMFIKIRKDNKEGTTAEVLNIDIKNLLPNAILTSPIFDFDDIINNNHKSEDRLMTEDDYDDAVFYRILEKKIREKNLNFNQ